MISIPLQLVNSFNIVLTRHNIDRITRNHYRKWLRYYLNFYNKYSFVNTKADSLSHCIKKIKKTGTGIPETSV